MSEYCKKLSQLKEEIEKIKAKDREIDLMIEEKRRKDFPFLCPGSKEKYCRKLSVDEARCFWIKNPQEATDFSK